DQPSQLAQMRRFRCDRPLERGFVLARHDPDLVGHARSEWTHGNIVIQGFNNPDWIAQFLSQGVTENAAFLFQVVSARSPQFVEYTPRNKRCCRELGDWMIEL